MIDRPSLPVKTKRVVLLESGYRCAIPTCRYPITENAHIVAWSESHNDLPSNLIALCPNCHTRFDKGEIPIDVIKHYKKMLVYLDQLYTKFELDVLDYLKTHKRAVLPSEIMVKRLFDEGLIKIEEVTATQSFEDGDRIPIIFSVILTGSGKNLIDEWKVNE